MQSTYTIFSLSLNYLQKFDVRKNISGNSGSRGDKDSTPSSSDDGCLEIMSQFSQQLAPPELDYAQQKEQLETHNSNITSLWKPMSTKEIAKGVPFDQVHSLMEAILGRSYC